MRAHRHEEGGVEVPCKQLDPELDRPADVHVDPDVRATPAKVVDDLAARRDIGQIGGRADAQRRRRTGQGAGLGVEGFHGSDHLAGVGQQAQGGRGRLDGAGRAAKQAHAQFSLELTDARGQPGLGDAKARGGGGEGSFLDHRYQKGVEPRVPEHGFTPSAWRLGYTYTKIG